MGIHLDTWMESTMSLAKNTAECLWPGPWIWTPLNLLIHCHEIQELVILLLAWSNYSLYMWVNKKVKHIHNALSIKIKWQYNTTACNCLVNTLITSITWVVCCSVFSDTSMFNISLGMFTSTESYKHNQNSHTFTNWHASTNKAKIMINIGHN